MISNGVVVLSGPPCSGKSTVGAGMLTQQAPQQRRWMGLQVDAVFDLLFPASDRNRDDRMRAYDGAHLLARMFLDMEEVVVLECTYARRDQRASLVNALAGSTAAMWVVEFLVSGDEAVDRFRARRQVTDLDDELVRERVDSFPYSDEALHIVSSSGTTEDHVRTILSSLQQGGDPIDREAWVRAGRGWN